MYELVNFEGIMEEEDEKRERKEREDLEKEKEGKRGEEKEEFVREEDKEQTGNVNDITMMSQPTKHLQSITMNKQLTHTPTTSPKTPPTKLYGPSVLPESV